MGTALEDTARSTLDNLTKTRFVHLISGLDERPAATPWSAATLTTISGYTEWVGGVTLSWSLGWDWMLDPTAVPPALKRSSAPHTNLVLISAAGTELHAAHAERLLGQHVDCLPWQQYVLAYIGSRYCR